MSQTKAQLVDAVDGSIVDADIVGMSSSKLSGTLPAVSAANLTNLPAANLTGTVADARISALTASKLTGALPAISGAALTGLEANSKVTRTVQSSALSGATNYDVTIPTNCFQVDFSGQGISTSGSGMPTFRVGNASGIITSNSYYFCQARYGSNNQGVYENGTSLIYPGGWFLGAAGDVADIHATFKKTGAGDKWTFSTTTSKRTNQTLQNSMGIAVCSNLTTVRLFPNGTGFDDGLLTWTCWSTT